MIPAEKATAARKTGSLPPQYSSGPADADAGTVIVEEEVIATEYFQSRYLSYLGGYKRSRSSAPKAGAQGHTSYCATPNRVYGSLSRILSSVA